MTSENWQNLALAGLAAFYVIQIGLDVVWHNLCGHLGVDYCAFWSAGRIANTFNYANIYNLSILGELERSLFPKFGNPATFAASPIAYLPVFILPFQALALLPLTLSFWIWTILNIGAMFFYLRFFIRSLTGQPPQNRMLIMILLSLPVYWNVLEGQVNVWLLICMGEFIRAISNDKPFRAGLWLGGLLLKPQTLVLIGIALLVQRSIKILAGLTASSLALIATSSALIGLKGFTGMLQIWLGFTKGIPTNDVEVMMNWRMLGLHLTSFAGPLIGWSITGMGMTATILISLYLWQRPIEPHLPQFTVAVLGTLAATGTVAWHSHIHTALFLIPPLLLLQQQDILPKNAIAYWVFFPSMAFIIAIMLATLIQARILPANMTGFLNFVRGGSEFAVNLYLLFWASRQSGNLVPKSAD